LSVGGDSSKGLKVGVAAALLILCGGFAAWRATDNRPKTPGGIQASASDALMITEGGWTTEFAGDEAGANRGRRMNIFRPTRELKDYRIEFSGEIEQGSLGWAFRFLNASNYYITKIEAKTGTGRPSLALVRYAVIDGVEGPVTVTPIPQPPPSNGVLHVRVEIKGPSFATSVQGQAVDLWTDTRLRTGGFGFVNERTERARIKSVQVAILR
jgi:hypothetical protein